jgi:hypothetical protein
MTTTETETETETKSPQAAHLAHKLWLIRQLDRAIADGAEREELQAWQDRIYAWELAAPSMRSAPCYR